MKTPIAALALLLILVGCKSEDPDVVGQPTPPPTAQYASPPAQPPPPQQPPPPHLNFPLDKIAAVVFEDRFPKTGDEDFNDFMTDFKIVEKVNSSNQITNIIIDFYPRAVGASYDHELLMVLNGIKQQPSNITLHTKPMFVGDATVKLTHYDQSLRVTDVQNNLPVDQDVVIFSSTHAIFDPSHLSSIINTELSSPFLPAKQIARLEISLAEPEKNQVTDNAHVDISQFRMVLHVKGGKKNSAEDIDIIDVDPNNYDHAAGYPYGFIIPTDWRWPQESVNIDSAYPVFIQYRQYLIARATQPNLQAPLQVQNWFNLPGPEKYLYRALPSPTLLPDP